MLRPPEIGLWYLKRPLAWTSRLLGLPDRCWQQVVAPLFPRSLWIRSRWIRRFLGISVQREPPFLRVQVPPNDVLIYPEHCADALELMAEALVSHWFSVTVLDSYDAHRFLTSGMTVLDVGANVGSFTLLASRLVGPTGRIIAVEPVPENWGCLAKFIDENHLGNVETAEIALGDQNGELLLDLGAKSGGHSAVLRRTGRYISVPQRTLDSLVEEFTIRDLGFMKIDVEGYEPEVLRGAEETIRRTRPIIAVSAYHLPEHQELLPSLISGITEDYSVYVRNLAPALELTGRAGRSYANQAIALLSNHGARHIAWTREAFRCAC